MATLGMLLSTQIPATQAELSFSETVWKMSPAGVSLLAITSRLREEKATNTEHGFWTKTWIFPSLKSSVADAAGVTTMTFVSTANVVPGNMFQNFRTKEQIIVNSIVSATQVTVARAMGTVAAAAAQINDMWYAAGNAYEEGSIRPAALNIQAVKITNYTQIFRNSWALTDTVRNIVMATNTDNVSESRADCMLLHAQAIEQAMISGQKYQGTRNNQPYRQMEGIITAIGTAPYYPDYYAGVTNVFTAGGTTNYTQLQNMLEPCLDQVSDQGASKERLVFTGSKGLRVFNDIGRLNGSYDLVHGQTEYGLQFSTFKTTRGTFTLVEHTWFNSNPDFAKMALVLDVNSIKPAYLGDRRQKHTAYNESGPQVDNGIDALGGTITSELTVLNKNPAGCAVIYGLTQGAAG